MKSPSIYLYFSGQCEEAFDFYQSVLGGSITMRSRYSDMPLNPDFPPIPEEAKDMIMHNTLTLSEDTIIQGADRADGFGPPMSVGDNFAISLTADNRAHADQLHERLSKNGKVTMPMQMTFWESYFGTCTDQFGINWMIAFNSESS